MCWKPPPEGGRPGLLRDHMIGRAAKVGHVGRRVLQSGICLGVATCVGFAATAAFSFTATAAWGEALPEALAKAYQSNPQLNAERARQEAATAYTNVLANQSLVEAQRSNVAFLREILGVTQRRLNAGDVTPTDTAQAEARLSRGQADLNAAEVNLAISRATYTQVIGNPPGQLRPAEPVDRYLPRSRDDATGMAFKEHPAVLAASFDVDVAL